jgi:hypothetical protein
VNLIDHSSKRVSVAPAKGWKQPRFAGGIGGLHPTITQRMKRVLTEESGYPFLNMAAVQLLGEARQTFANAGLDAHDIVVSFSGVEWFPWCGSRVLLTLELCAKADGVKTERDDLCLRYQKLTPADFIDHRKRISSGAFSPEQLVKLVPDLQRDRFDEHVPEPLLQQAFVAEVLDLANAQTIAGAV